MISWWWLIIAFIFGYGFGQEDKWDRQKKKRKSDED